MDSDSDSGDDSSKYVETKVLLGWPTKEATGDSTKLGGTADWIDGKTAPTGALAKCKACNDFMSLLLQVNGDMPERFPGHERRLYVFGCRRKTCRRKDGSIRGIRGSRVTKAQVAEKKAAPIQEQQQSKPAIDIGSTLFGTKATGSNISSNPFSSNTQSSMANPFSAMSSMAAKPAQRVESLPETFASKARISDSATTPTQSPTPRPHEPWPSSDAMPAPYPQFFLDAEYETLSAPPTPQVPKTMPDIDEGEAGSSGGAEDKTLFESSMDKAFQKFADRIENNPEQAIRYEYGGSPLLYSDNDAMGKLFGGTPKTLGKISVQGSSASKAPRCTNCGAGRVFEVQLVPYAITVLEEDEMSIDGMEWGTVMLFVCEKDCTPQGTAEKQVGYTEEFVAVQWEELAGKSR